LVTEKTAKSYYRRVVNGEQDRGLNPGSKKRYARTLRWYELVSRPAWPIGMSEYRRWDPSGDEGRYGHKDVPLRRH
jgi:hypothetical protein